MKVILASASPRRKELLEMVGIRPLVIRPEIDEQKVESESIPQFLRRITIEKGNSVDTKGYPDHIKVSSDTIVVLDNDIIGKPRNLSHAKEILTSLSGRTHSVWTGIALYLQGQVLYDHAVTEVTFSVLSADEIDAYLQRTNYKDKAGAYGIQGLAAIFIERINGCYYNVMGFPLELFNSMIKKLKPGISLL